MRLRERLILHTVLLVFFSVLCTSIAIGCLSYYTGKHALEQEKINQLVSIREAKKEELERYFTFMKQQIKSLANMPTVITALEDLSGAFHRYGQELNPKLQVGYKASIIQRYLEDFKSQLVLRGHDPKALNVERLLNLFNETSFALQYYYILSNMRPLDQKDELETVNDNTSYSRLHQKYHAQFRDFLKRFGYHDIFLVNMNGEVIYSAYKSLDFTSSLLDGNFAATELGRVYQKVSLSVNPEFVALSDFKPYLPSYNESTAFIAAPIYKGAEKIGALVFELAIHDLNTLMTNNGHWKETGLGDTGELYLVGDDYRLRTLSRVSTGVPNVPTMGIEKAFEEQKSGVERLNNYHNEPAFVAYAPLDIPGLKWAIVSEMSLKELLQPFQQLSVQLILFSALIVSVLGCVSLYFCIRMANQISTPLVNSFRRSSEMVQSTMQTLKHISKTTPLTPESESHFQDLSQKLNTLSDKFAHLEHAKEHTSDW